MKKLNQYLCEAPEGYKIMLFKDNDKIIAIGTSSEKPSLKRTIHPVLDDKWHEIVFEWKAKND